MDSQLSKVPRLQGSWGQHGAHLGPVGPRWAPCWPYEPCYEGNYHKTALTHCGRGKNGRRFADDTFKRIFLNENVIISIKISLKFVPKVRISNIPALVQIMTWRRPGDKPLSEQMMVSLQTHICITRSQWVNGRFREIKQLWLTNIRCLYYKPNYVLMKKMIWIRGFPLKRQLSVLEHDIDALHFRTKTLNQVFHMHKHYISSD